jgi:hypothetical protein
MIIITLVSGNTIDLMGKLLYVTNPGSPTRSSRFASMASESLQSLGAFTSLIADRLAKLVR